MMQTTYIESVKPQQLAHKEKNAANQELNMYDFRFFTFDPNHINGYSIPLILINYKCQTR